MQILSTSQIRQWDEYTIRREPIASLDLMERAARTCVEWLMQRGYRGRTFRIFCGKGNNGGDGLAIARLLAGLGHDVTVYILEFGHLGTEDFQQNLARLHDTSVLIKFISTPDALPLLPDDPILLDALLGSGLNRPVEGLTAELVQHLNRSGNEIIAIDIPSGLFADNSSANTNVVRANHTLSFQCYKLAFVLPENQDFVGQLHVLDIGLHSGFLSAVQPLYRLVDAGMVTQRLQPRKRFSHKGNFGHACLIAGSKGMMGAAVLSARACLRSGVGKLTCHIPEAGYLILQSSVPEAMARVEKGEHQIESATGLDLYNSIGIGPGLGQPPGGAALLKSVFRASRHPMVIDADALNILSRHPGLLPDIPAGSLLTPHVGEFDRLFGASANDLDRIKKAAQKAGELNLVIVVKGAFSFIALPGQQGYFNTSGNPGMATGGSGDVLTGVLTGLLAQGYSSADAALTGVYLHGLAGDLAAANRSMPALVASDITEYLGAAFRQLNG